MERDRDDIRKQKHLTPKQQEQQVKQYLKDFYQDDKNDDKMLTRQDLKEMCQKLNLECWGDRWIDSKGNEHFIWTKDYLDDSWKNLEKEEDYNVFVKVIQALGKK